MAKLARRESFALARAKLLLETVRAIIIVNVIWR
jgi:hypothetical protein